jgi:predicted nucleic acid-binding protein
LREVVLDASVVLKWLATEQRGSFEARQLRGDCQAGRLSVVVPPILFLELVDVAGTRWRWEAEAAGEVANFGDLSFEESEPESPSVAAGVSRGLTAYDAAYVALAERTRRPGHGADAVVVATGQCGEPVGLIRSIGHVSAHVMRSSSSLVARTACRMIRVSRRRTLSVCWPTCTSAPTEPS